MISPHLDDVVISCGALLLAHPGATVATLFAASPPAYTDPLNEHDTDVRVPARRRHDGGAARGGRARARAPSARRRAGCRCARTRTSRAPTRSRCRRARSTRSSPRSPTSQPTCVVAPLGFSHVDHQACHASALAARERVGAAAVALVQRPALHLHPAGARRRGSARCTRPASPRRPRARRCRTTSTRSGARSSSTRRRCRCSTDSGSCATGSNARASSTGSSTSTERD